MLSEKKRKRKRKYEYGSKGFSIRTQILASAGGASIPDRIIEFANNEKVDLIVIGNAGLTGIHKVKALGSISRGISERYICPVLIVH